MGVTFNVIGAGHLGKTIAKLLVEKRAATLGGVICRGVESAIKAQEFIGAGTACVAIRDLPKADVFFIMTPDREIKDVCRLLVESDRLEAGNIVLHCGGFLSSSELDFAKQKGCFVVSVHPIKGFENAAYAVETFAGTFCSYEGDEEACRVIVPLFESIGGNLFEIDKNKKHIYYAGNVFACNYFVTLFDVALKCYADAAVDRELSKKIICSLMKVTLENLVNKDPKDVLTGPVQREEIGIIEQLCDTLKSDAMMFNLFCDFCRSSSGITEHSDFFLKQLHDLLESKQIL